MAKEGAHAGLTYEVIGCAQRIHSEVGPGFPESVYHKAMCLELVSKKIPFETEKKIEVLYQKTVCGEFRMGLLVNQVLVVELKALANLNDDHLAQALSYMKATNLDVGLLLNFGKKSLQVKRVVSAN